MVLLSGKDGRSPANRFLVYFLVSMTVVMFMLYVIQGGFIVEIPWLYRLPSPMYYFMFPAAYIYVRMILLDEARPRKTDWLHAIPALLHLVEMTPYYLSSNQRKLEHILADSTNPLGAVAHSEGWLPGYMHNFIRGCIGVIYALLMMRLLWHSRRRRPAGFMVFPEMIQWLWVLSSMLMLFSLSLVMAFIAPGQGSLIVRSALLYTILAATQIVSGLYLMLNPSLLFGMPKLEKMVGRLRLMREGVQEDKPYPVLAGPLFNIETNRIEPPFHAQQPPSPVEMETPKEELAESLPFSMEEEGKEIKRFPQEMYDDFINRMTRLMEDEKPFLRQRYSISELAHDVKVPQHHISYLLNNIFQIRYNDYINQFRIRYLKDRMAKENLSHMTLEGLALEAGFSSRITFIRVVQKQTGMKPSEYFKLDLAEAE
ncbi:MAG: helix-turn-helix domain-containing protein [Chitinophagaceae bacterium]|nr:helix-turn-helix domain-containing protein [Chitinophagaceae bacterium]